ncbi:MAG: transitional endoplasmic reticulum ATPase [archaeon GW2011_AR19]|nr:MAG: transitional endoplasmic reticulum ATPase [archaeon GW2011_AR19]
MTEKEIQLNVVEAMQDDVYKGIARIDSATMKELGITRGDIITIKGNRETVAIVDRAYPSDIGEKIIRVDGILRRNARTSIGEIVKISKANIKEAKKIIIAPAQKGIMVQADSNSLRRGLLGRIVVKGDLVILGGVQKRKDLLSDEFGDEFGGMLGDMLGNMGMGTLGRGITQIKFLIVNASPVQPVIITENTEITLNPKAVEVSEEDAPGINYEDIGGLEEEIKKIREMVEIPLKHPEIFEKLGIESPKGVLLHGPPGTGKTLLAKAVATETDANFILLNGPEVMSKFYGESEKKIRDIFESAEKNAPSIIFIDELDAIAPKREDVGGEVERRVVSQLLTMMDGLKARGKVIVIGATNRINAIDPALRRPGRFDREISIGAPSKGGRLSILKIHTRGMPLTKDVKLEDLASVTHGFVGADLEALAKEAAMVVLRGLLPQMKLDEEEKIPQHLLDKLKIHYSDFLEALKVVRPSAMREVLVETPNINWNDVGGLEDVKRELREAVEWPIKHPESFKRLGIRPSKGILLYGPPGTGKTLLAKAVAKESEANFIQVKGPSLLSMWVGKSEEGMRKIFERARQVAPCIVFFDEIDSLAGKRGMEQGTKVTERVLNQMLAEMDGIEDVNDILVIGATNRPDMLDPAILRPGRFDKILLVNAPDEIGRENILKIHTKNMPITLTKEEIKELDDTFKNEKINFTYSKMASDKSLNEEDLNKLKNKNKIDFKSLSDKDKLLYYLAKKAEGYTGADLEAFVREAAILSLRENMDTDKVHKKHFEEALSKIKPSVTTNTIKVYKKVEEQFLKSAKSATPMQEGSYLG